VRNLCENLRDQAGSYKADPWKEPVRYNKKKFPDEPDLCIKYRRKERRLYKGIVYVCTESHTATPDHKFNPEVESTVVNHRKPKWAIDRSCKSTFVAMTIHLVVMVIIVASVLTFIVDSLNYEYCKNVCPTYSRDASGNIVNCSIPEADNPDLTRCNPVDNNGVPCDKEFGPDSLLGSVMANASVNFYCTYHVAKGIMGNETIFAFDVFFTVVFIIELLVRLLVAEKYCGKKKEDDESAPPFFADGLNWCDFLAIIPLPVQQALLAVGIDNSLRTEALQSDSSGVGSSLALLLMLELFKLLRVVRVFKIARHFSGTRVMVKTVQKSMRPVRLTFIVLFLVFTVLGSALMLFEPCFGAPGSDECQFPDLFTAGYYLMITILTVGYGDQTPKTDMGRLIGILCMILGSCFLAMPLAIVGNKFQAAYAQEQAENGHENDNRSERLTKGQRKQRTLNEAFIMLGTIDHLARVNNKSAQQRESAIGNLFKTHHVLTSDMSILFEHLKDYVDAMRRRNETADEDEDDDGGCCGDSRRRNARVAPDTSTRSLVHQPLEDEESLLFNQREEAEKSKKCRDKLWLCLEVHESSKCATAAYVIRHLMVMFALVVSMLMMFHELNRWDEVSTPCQKMASTWCNMIHSLPDDWVYEMDPQLDVSGRFDGYTKADVLRANPVCGNMTCDSGLSCRNISEFDSVSPENITYAGCIDENNCFDSGNIYRRAVKCPSSDVVEPESSTSTIVYTPTYAEITETVTVTEYDASRDYFDETALSMRLMWDQTPVCERLVCQNNTEFAYFASLNQHELNLIFGVLELFFCFWFVAEFSLRVAAARDLRKFFKSLANWLELICAFVATYELVILSARKGALTYEVWGLPSLKAFPYDHVRPFRIIVPLRFLLMSRRWVLHVVVHKMSICAPLTAMLAFFCAFVFGAATQVLTYCWRPRAKLRRNLPFQCSF